MCVCVCVRESVCMCFASMCVCECERESVTECVFVNVIDSLFVPLFPFSFPLRSFSSVHWCVSTYYIECLRNFAQATNVFT